MCHRNNVPHNIIKLELAVEKVGQRQQHSVMSIIQAETEKQMRDIRARCPVNRKVLISLPGQVIGVGVRELATPNPGPSSPEPKASPSSRPLSPTPSPHPPHPTPLRHPPPSVPSPHPQCISVTSTAHGFPPAAQAWQALHGSKRIKCKEKAVAH